MQFYGIGVSNIVTSPRLFIWMRERNAVRLHVQVFLRMNIRMFEPCRRHYSVCTQYHKFSTLHCCMNAVRRMSCTNYSHV